MEAGRSLGPFPTKFLPLSCHRNCSSSVLLPNEQISVALASSSTASLGRNLPTSVLSQGSRKSTCLEEFQRLDSIDKPLNDNQLQMLSQPGLWYLWPSFLRKVQSLNVEPDCPESSVGVEANCALSLARQALSASLEAVTIVKDAKLNETHIDDLSSSRDLASKRTVRSTRISERLRKKRRVPRVDYDDTEDNNHSWKQSRQKTHERMDLDDPFRLFLRGSEKTRVLTAREESELIMKIQEFMKIREVKSNLQTQFSREPTLVEWASAAGITCQALQSQIRTGESSREKLIYANFRMVVHIAKQYQGRGLSIQDLLQEGSLGLMHSVERFKPQIGCRFATYAYWWVRQAIKKALFQHSRTIRLPENVYGLLARVYEARNLCRQQGKSKPSLEELSSVSGIPVKRLETVLQISRTPVSLQQAVYTDQDATFQEVTADIAIEATGMAVEKSLMRQHARSLLNLLNPRERQILRLRFGINDGEQRSLQEIGQRMGLTKERIRQLENRALYKLKQSLESQGLAAYADLLI